MAAGAAGALVESVWLAADVARVSRLRASSLDDGLYLNFVWYGSMGAGHYLQYLVAIFHYHIQFALIG